MCGGGGYKGGRGGEGGNQGRGREGRLRGAVGPRRKVRVKFGVFSHHMGKSTRWPHRIQTQIQTMLPYRIMHAIGFRATRWPHQIQIQIILPDHIMNAIGSHASRGICGGALVIWGSISRGHEAQQLSK